MRQVAVAAFPYRYACARSADSRAAGDPGQDYLALAHDDHTFVFALCDGVSQSFYGDLAASFLGEKLVEWLGDRVPPALDPAPIAGALTTYLRDLTGVATRQVQRHPLPTGIPAMLRTVLEEKRALGSETTFVCGRVDLPGAAFPDGRVVLAWMGDSRLRLWGPTGEQTQQLLGDTFQTEQRWSTWHGPVRGDPHVFVARLSQDGSLALQQLAAYSDGLAALDEVPQPPDDDALQALIARTGELPTSDDVSFLEVQISLPATVGPVERVPSPEVRPAPTEPPSRSSAGSLPAVSASSPRPRPVSPATPAEPSRRDPAVSAARPESSRRAPSPPAHLPDTSQQEPRAPAASVETSTRVSPSPTPPPESSGPEPAPPAASAGPARRAAAPGSARRGASLSTPPPARAARLPTPRDVAVRQVGEGVRVSWRPVEGATRYGVRLSDRDEDIERSGVDECDAPPWEPPVLPAGDYRVQVRAYRDHQPSDLPCGRLQSLFRPARVQAQRDRQQSDWSDVQIVRVVAGSGAVAPHSDSAGHLASRSANGKPAAASPLWLTIGAVALIVLGLAVALVCYGPAAYERIVGNPSGPAAPPTVAPTPRAPTSAPGSGNATRGTAIIPPPSPTAGGTPPALSGAGPAKAEATVLRPTIVDDFYSAAATEVAGKAGATLTPRLAPTSTPPPPAAAPTRGTTVTRTVTPTPSTPTSAVTPTPALTPR